MQAEGKHSGLKVLGGPAALERAFVAAQLHDVSWPQTHPHVCSGVPQRQPCSSHTWLEGPGAYAQPCLSPAPSSPTIWERWPRHSQGPPRPGKPVLILGSPPAFPGAPDGAQPGEREPAPRPAASRSAEPQGPRGLLPVLRFAMKPSPPRSAESDAATL